MADYVAGAGALLLVLFLPGTLVVVAARLDLRWSETVAFVPLCSFGAIFTLAVWESALGLPFGPIGFVLLLVVLAAIAVARSRAGVWLPSHVQRPDLRGGEGAAPRRVARVIALVLLGLSFVIALAIWIDALDGRSASTPNFDSSRHSFVIARIASAGTIESSEVLTTDGLGQHPALDFYPVGVHSALAVAHRFGVPIATLMNMVVVLCAAVLFPLGMYALTRFLLPDEPLAAGFSALVAVLVSTFPYRPIAFGGVSLLVGLALVPIAVVVLARAFEETASKALVCVAALASVALFAVHTSELVVALLMVFCVVITAPRSTGWRVRAVAVLKRAGLIGAVALAMVLPTLTLLLGGADERWAFDDTSLRSVGEYLTDVAVLRVDVPWRQGWLAILSLGGVAVLLWSRRFAWVLATISIGVLATLAATSRDPVSELLTLPWYRQPTRVTYSLALIVPVLCGAALATLCAWVWHALRTRWAYVGVAAVALAFVYAFVMKDAVPRNIELVRSGYIDYRPVGRDEIAAFDFMGSRLARGEQVLSDGDVDGSLWMYAFSGAPPVFALPSSFEEGVYPKAPSYLRDHIGDIATDGRARKLTKRFHVRYVYFGEEVFAGSRHRMSLERLRSTPALREVFHRGGAHVFVVRIDD